MGAARITGDVDGCNEIKSAIIGKTMGQNKRRYRRPKKPKPLLRSDGDGPGKNGRHYRSANI